MGGGGEAIIPQCVLADMHSKEQMHVAFNYFFKGGGGVAVSKQGAKRPQKPQGLLGTGKKVGGVGVWGGWGEKKRDSSPFHYTVRTAKSRCM